MGEEFGIALANLVLQMLADGYECKAPHPDVAQNDREVVAVLACRRCGDKGLHYEPFTLYDKDGNKMSYRAFTVCETCGKVQEF